MSGGFPTRGRGDLANALGFGCAKLPETGKPMPKSTNQKEVPVVRYVNVSQTAAPAEADVLIERLKQVAPILAALAAFMAMMFGTIYFAVDMAVGGMGSLRDDFHSLRDDVRHLSAVVYELRDDVAELKVDVATLKVDVAELKQDVAVLKADVAVLKQDVAMLKQDVAVLKADVATLKADVAEIRVELARNRADIDTLDQRVDSLEVAAAGS